MATERASSATSFSAGMVNAFDPSAAGGLPATDRELIARRQNALGTAYRLFYQKPVHLVRGQGCRLWDADGNEYLDAYNNVASVGHCHPHVIEALTQQAMQLNTHTRYLHETVVAYAERLLATMPAEIDRAMFTCTGSEANDLAMRIARHATGGTGVVVTSLAYHGVTAAVADFSPSLGVASPLGIHVRTVPLPMDAEGEEVGKAFGDAVSAAFADLKRHGIKPAALIVDTIFSSDGVFADPPGFLKAGVDAARAAGALFIADEVQPGLGRTGAGMWGFGRHGVVPDLVTCGKPMGNGHPVAACFARGALADGFGRELRYFNTFGGNPVSAAVGMAVLDVIESEGLITAAADTGAFLMDGLRTMRTHREQIGDIRGAGLFIGVDLLEDGKPSAEQATALVNALRDRRILISATGPNANVLKIRPPMAFGRKEAERVLAEIDDLLRSR